MFLPNKSYLIFHYLVRHFRLLTLKITQLSFGIIVDDDVVVVAVVVMVV